MVTTGIHRTIIFYPNSGELWDAENEQWVEGSGANRDCFANTIKDAITKIDAWCEEGAHFNGGITKKLPMIVGGCCRTSPGTISALRNVIDSYLSSIN